VWTDWRIRDKGADRGSEAKEDQQKDGSSGLGG
jgi:hypothetical protein